MACKKKLYQYRPGRVLAEVETFRTSKRIRIERSQPADLERGVRQLLADKINGSMLGLFLLVPEHLRLGIWDLLTRWAGTSAAEIQPRLGLQLVHEAALCLTGIRAARSLNLKGFELVNGLPFIGSDQAVHDFLDGHTVHEAEALQLALGKVRRARGDFKGRLLAVDPHRIRSYSQRQMARYRGDLHSRPFKVTPTFFCLDAETSEPVCFEMATGALSVPQVTPALLRLTAEILGPLSGSQPLVLADIEHYAAALIDTVDASHPFDLLVPMPRNKNFDAKMRAIPAHKFVRHWAGFATLKEKYRISQSHTGPHWRYIQRFGEVESEYQYKCFFSTTDRDEVDALTRDFPQRWHIEEFFNLNQALGWNRAGTQNLNVRYGHMTAALLAQAAISPLRRHIGGEVATWDAKHLANDFFRGLSGDARVKNDTIVVTYYNAPRVDRLRECYEHLPQKLAQENVDPRVPWLYNFKLDFRFK